jgi:hypothetical protein
MYNELLDDLDIQSQLGSWPQFYKFGENEFLR